MEESGTELLTREQRLASPISSSFMGSISNRPLSLLALAPLMISKSHVYSDQTVTYKYKAKVASMIFSRWPYRVTFIVKGPVKECSLP